MDNSFVILLGYGILVIVVTWSNQLYQENTFNYNKNIKNKNISHILKAKA